MVRVIFTLDYENNGNGEGSSYDLMVEPTDRLLALFDQYGARLTIMADIGEILKFKEFAGLKADRMDEMVKLGKDFLESIIRPVRNDYRCNVFRAANWSVSPSRDVVRSLVRNGIRIDTSVFKYGRRDGLVSFDYKEAASEMVPWRADENAIWRQDPTGQLWEVPIYAENRRLGAFLSMNRMYRFAAGRFHRIPSHLQSGAANGSRSLPRRLPMAKRLGRLAAKYA